MSSFDEIVAAMDTAMVVVTVADGDERDGCLVGFHSQCSIEPPRYVVWLSRANRTFEMASRATHLAVHPLAADDHPLAAHFGGETGDEVDKLAGVEWSPGPGGVPLLAGVAHIAGEIVERLDTDADHVGFVLAPVSASGSAPSAVLRLSAADDIDPGHDAEERR
ncbi:MAG TPA: flavin reductase family protein [Acidimicrobiales bacterium]